MIGIRVRTSLLVKIAPRFFRALLHWVCVGGGGGGGGISFGACLSRLTTDHASFLERAGGGGLHRPLFCSFSDVYECMRMRACGCFVFFFVLLVIRSGRADVGWQ